MAGGLSAAEMYQVEYLMLENDFCFEAMEGLERVPWDHCQQAIESAGTRIRSQYNISSNERRRNTRIMALALAVALSGLGLFWAFNHNDSKPVDLSNDTETVLPPASTGTSNQVDQDPLQKSNMEKSTDSVAIIVDNAAVMKPQNNSDIPIGTEESTRSISKQEKADDRSSNLPLHIAVGRIVDPNGLALNGVSVRVGGEQSQTDQSGYYTLNLPSGKMTLMLEYAGINTETEIDSDQNWWIVLDVNQGKVIESQALNTANRFK